MQFTLSNSMRAVVADRENSIRESQTPRGQTDRESEPETGDWEVVSREERRGVGGGWFHEEACSRCAPGGVDCGEDEGEQVGGEGLKLEAERG